MCDFCEYESPAFPSVADYPDLDVEMYIEPFVNIDTKRHGMDLVVYKIATDSEARFKISYCPMCGRKLGGDS